MTRRGFLILAPIGFVVGAAFIEVARQSWGTSPVAAFLAFVFGVAGITAGLLCALEGASKPLPARSIEDEASELSPYRREAGR